MSSFLTVLLRYVLVSACALSLSLSATGCASSGSSGGKGEKVRISLRGYKGNQFFELVSESHTNPVEYYSQARTSAARKIIDDELVVALAKEMGKRGFKKNKKPGRAPSQGGSVLTWGIEVARDSGVDHWVVGRGTPGDEMIAFGKVHTVFLEVYNAYNSYQTVTNQSGRNIFDTPKSPPAGVRQ